MEGYLPEPNLVVITRTLTSIFAALPEVEAAETYDIFEAIYGLISVT